MDIKKLSNMADNVLRSTIVEKRDNLVKVNNSYKCLWTDEKHRGDLQSTIATYNRHIVGCKHRAEHQSVFIENSDQAFRFPVIDEEDYTKYRLRGMDSCFEFHYERLGDKGWKSYPNKLEHLLVDFFTKYCNMGKVGYQQSVLFNGSLWKYKINSETPYKTVNSKKMFNYFVKEFKTIIDENIYRLNDGEAIEFWKFMLTGKRSYRHQKRLDEEELLKNKICKPTIREPYKLGPKGEIIFI